MKHLLLFLSIAAFGSCQKFEASYHLNCQFERGFVPRWLVVTDYKGRVLGTEEVARGKSTFSGDFTTHDSDSPDSFDVHLIYQESFTHSYWIYSHLGVYNGSALYINPVEQEFPNDQELNIHIDGIPELAYMKFYESTGYNYYYFDAFLQQVSIHMVAETGEGIVLRVKLNGEPFYRSLYLPDTMFNPLDTTTVSWNAFLPETNSETVTFEKELSTGIVRVEAVSPDLKHFVTLFYTNGSFSGTSIKFNRPAGLPADWLYRVSGFQNGVTFDKLYPLNEDLRVEALDKGIEATLREGGQLFLEAPSDIDVIRASCSAQNPTDPNSNVFWQIMGRPTSFAGYSIPFFDQIMPAWANPKTVVKSGSIRASKFDLYEYEQIQAGFPYQLKERFAFPKSGFMERWVFF